MKSRKGLWMLLAVFIVLMAGALVLYQKLSASVENEQLAAVEPEKEEMEENGKEEETEEIEENSEEADTQEEAQKVAAPDFTVYDAQGNAVSLSDFLGKPVIVNFWASWCGPCKSEMPDFEEAYQQYGEEIQFLMINMTDGSQETVEIAKSFIEEQGYTFPVYYDTESDGAVTYGVSSIPTTYFMDAEGNAVAYARGALNASNLQQGIDMILPEI